MESAIMSSYEELAGTENSSCHKEECLANIMRIGKLRKQGEELGAQYDELLERNTELVGEIRSLQFVIPIKDKMIRELKDHLERCEDELYSITQFRNECQLKLEAEKRSREKEMVDLKGEIKNLEEINEQLLRSVAGHRHSVVGDIRSPELACDQSTFKYQDGKQTVGSPFSPYLEEPLDSEVNQPVSLQEELAQAGETELEWCNGMIAQGDIAAQGCQGSHRMNTDTTEDSTGAGQFEDRAADNEAARLEHALFKEQRPITHDGVKVTLYDVKLSSGHGGDGSLARPSITDDEMVRGEGENANHQPGPSTRCFPIRHESHSYGSFNEENTSEKRGIPEERLSNSRISALASNPECISIENGRHKGGDREEGDHGCNLNHHLAYSSTYVKLKTLHSYADRREFVDIMAVVTANIKKGEDEIDYSLFLKDESRTDAPSVETVIYKSHIAALQKVRKGDCVLLRNFVVHFNGKKIPYLESRDCSTCCVWDQFGGSIRLRHMIPIREADLEGLQRLLKWWESLDNAA